MSAGALIAGQTYDVTLEYNIFSDVLLSSGLGVPAYALYGTQTHFTLVTVPEPANVATALAVGALLAVVWRACRLRRRRL